MAKRAANAAKMIIVLLVVAAGVVALVLWQRGGEVGQPQERVMPAVPVETVLVQSVSLQETVRGIGTLRPLASVELASEINGRVRRLNFTEGSAVQEGQVLFELRDEKLQQQLRVSQAALAAAEARLENARLRLDRVSRAAEQGGATAAELDEARLDMDAARADIDRYSAEVELVREQLADTRITAPFDGVVSERLIDAGAYVSTGDALVRLLDISSVEMLFGIPERHMGRVRLGQRVEVAVAAFPDRAFVGELTYVSPEVREASRDFLVKAQLPNPDHLLKPGASATAVVIVDVRDDRPAVPEEALVSTRHGYMVFIVNGERATMRPVRTGLRQNGLVEITDGLDVGELIVRAGHMRVADGMAVRIVSGDQPLEPGESVPAAWTRNGSEAPGP